MKKIVLVEMRTSERADKAVREVDEAVRVCVTALDGGKVRPSASGLVRDALGLVRDASGLVRDASGLVRDASGLVRDASGLITDVFELVKGTGVQEDVEELVTRADSIRDCASEYETGNVMLDSEDTHAIDYASVSMRDVAGLLRDVSGLIRDASGVVRDTGTATDASGLVRGNGVR